MCSDIFGGEPLTEIERKVSTYHLEDIDPMALAEKPRLVRNAPYESWLS